MDPDATAGNEAVDTARQLPRHGFEIVDKRSGKEVYLDGSWAEMFQKQIIAWQLDAPTEEEVEDALDRYAGLAQDRKSTRLNSSHLVISYAVFCLKKKKNAHRQLKK